MGSYNFHKLKGDKPSMIHKHRLLRKIANLFRYIEFCVVLVLISRLSFQLPVAVKNSSEYLCSFSISPCFVFLIGNVIIISLFAQSGHFTPQSYKRDNHEPDFYQEFIQSSTKYQLIQEEQKKQLAKQSIETEHPEKQNLKTEDSKKSQRINSNLIKHPEKQSNGTKCSEKHVMKEEDRKKSEGINNNLIKCSQKQSMKRITKTEDRVKGVEKQRTKSGETNIVLEVKGYRRCQSEIISMVKSENPCVVLKRCDTEISIEHGERVGRNSYPEDGMSSDQFRCTIEAFIARQKRLREQEQCLALTF
ncbi:hypothetical protein TanjilG_12297 [Lupinus angustifolius]|uniref:DUF4408 domain-containing protein n=1 Tax=Lupinus angustifolius TaxID=3871 RepID=A0A4P1QY26_LUPAN|nr:hypothetical protein TanjilG_12297 [Lupinus angustifolius]